MAERSFFFNSLNGDRQYQADDFVSYFKELVTNGVFKDSSELNLKVQAYSGMKVRVNKGAAIINGYRYLNDANLDLTIEASDNINPRIDLIVLRLDIVNREITAVIKKGTPGSVPVKPTLITDSVVEIALASVRVNAGAVSITTSNITDERVFSHSYLDVNHSHKLSNLEDDINNITLVDFYSKLEPTGQLKLPGGFILKWGTVVVKVKGGGVTLTKEFDERFPNGGLKGWGQVRNCGNDYTAIRMNTIVRAWDSSVTIVVQQVAGTIIEDNTDCEIEWYALGK